MAKKGIYDDLTNKKFGKLLVVNLNSHRIIIEPKRKRTRTYWNCICECGNKTIVESSHLKDGHTTSCGCKVKEQREKFKTQNLKNGLSNTRIWRIYWNMINRCYNSSIKMYNWYGARNIKVCDEWLSKNNGFINFCEWAFKNGYTENLTLDRINNNGNYMPKNCRWVDMITQANNKRTNVYLKINNEIQTVAQISRKYNISYNSLLNKTKNIKEFKIKNLKIKVLK